jgi:hypothetical protein
MKLNLTLSSGLIIHAAAAGNGEYDWEYPVLMHKILYSRSL